MKLHEYRQTAAQRAAALQAIEAALLRAGDAGMRMGEIVAATGLSEGSIRWHAAHADFSVRAETKCGPRMRIYHRRHAAACEAYRLAADAIPPNRVGPSQASKLRALQAVVDSGRRGLRAADLAAHCRLGLHTIHSMMRELQVEHGVHTCVDPACHPYRTHRYYAAGVVPDVAPIVIAKQAAPTARVPRKPHIGPAALPGEAITTARTKWTIDRRVPGPRFADGNARLVFARELGVGRYEPADSAIARAYGTR